MFTIIKALTTHPQHELKLHELNDYLHTSLQYSYFANLKILIPLSRVFVTFNEIQDQKKRHITFEIMDTTIKRDLLRNPDFPYIMDLPLDKNFIPYVNNPSNYKVLLATDKIIEQEAVILWISEEDYSQGNFIIYEGEFLCLLTDKYFRVLALIEWILPRHFNEIKETYINNKQIVEYQGDEIHSKLEGKISNSGDSIFYFFRKIQNINHLDLLFYGISKKIINIDFLTKFAKYVETINCNQFDPSILKKISELQILPKSDKKEIFNNLSSENILEIIWVLLKLVCDLYDEHIIDPQKLADILISKGQFQNYFSIIHEKEFQILSLLNHIDTEALLYFGLYNNFNGDKYISDYAIFLLLKDPNVKDEFILDLAGLTINEMSKVDKILRKKIINLDEKLHNNALVYNKLWYFIHTISSLVKKGII